MIRKWLKKTAAVAVILVIVFSPFLLLVDFKRFVPVVLTLWLLMAVYFIFLKNRS